MNGRGFLLWAAGMTTLLACSSGSGGSGSGSGTVTFSCNASAANLCTQLLVPSSEVPSESSSCTESEKGTPGTGCPTTGVVGCCTFTSGGGDEVQCYYSASVAMAGMSACTSEQGTWSTTMP